MRGHTDEGLRAAELVLELPVKRRGWRISVLVNAAALAERRGLAEKAVEHYRAADELLQEVIDEIDDWGKDLDQATRDAHCAAMAGQQAWCRVRRAVLGVGSSSTSRLADEAVELARRGGGHTLGLVLAGAGEAAYTEARYERASELYAESAVYLEAAGDVIEVARIRLVTGAAAWAQGRLASAEACYREALDVSRNAGDSDGVAEALRNLADLALLRRDDRAQDLVADAVSQYEDLGDPKGLVISRVLRLRGGEAQLANKAVDEAASFRDDTLLVDALLAALAAGSARHEVAAWADLARPATRSLPVWLRAVLDAAFAACGDDDQELCAAVRRVADTDHPIGCLESLHVLERIAANAEVRDAARDLRPRVLDALSAAEASASRPTLPPWDDELCAVVQRSGRPTTEEHTWDETSES